MIFFQEIGLFCEFWRIQNLWRWNKLCLPIWSHFYELGPGMKTYEILWNPVAVSKLKVFVVLAVVCWPTYRFFLKPRFSISSHPGELADQPIKARHVSQIGIGFSHSWSPRVTGWADWWWVTNTTMSDQQWKKRWMRFWTSLGCERFFLSVWKDFDDMHYAPFFSVSGRDDVEQQCVGYRSSWTREDKTMPSYCFMPCSHLVKSTRATRPLFPAWPRDESFALRWNLYWRKAWYQYSHEHQRRMGREQRTISVCYPNVHNITTPWQYKGSKHETTQDPSSINYAASCSVDSGLVGWQHSCAMEGISMKRYRISEYSDNIVNKIDKND